jgi:hypothetical protein
VSGADLLGLALQLAAFAAALLLLALTQHMVRREAARAQHGTFFAVATAIWLVRPAARAPLVGLLRLPSRQKNGSFRLELLRHGVQDGEQRKGQHDGCGATLAKLLIHAKADGIDRHIVEGAQPRIHVLLLQVHRQALN